MPLVQPPRLHVGYPTPTAAVVAVFHLGTVAQRVGLGELARVVVLGHVARFDARMIANAAHAREGQQRTASSGCRCFRFSLAMAYC